MVKLLIGADAEVTQWCRFGGSDYPSSEAVQDGVHFQDCSALYVASTSGYRDVVELLLAAGADPSGVHSKVTLRDGSEDQYSILECMAEIEHGQLSHQLATDVARVLLAAGANVDEVFGNDNESALVVAVRRGNLELIELLTNANVDAAAGKERVRLPPHPPPPPVSTLPPSLRRAAHPLHWLLTSSRFLPPPCFPSHRLERRDRPPRQQCPGQKDQGRAN